MILLAEYSGVEWAARPESVVTGPADGHKGRACGEFRSAGLGTGTGDKRRDQSGRSFRSPHEGRPCARKPFQNRALA